MLLWGKQRLGSCGGLPWTGQSALTHFRTGLRGLISIRFRSSNNNNNNNHSSIAAVRSSKRRVNPLSGSHQIPEMQPTSHGGAQWHQRAASESLCLATTRALVTIPCPFLFNRVCCQPGSLGLLLCRTAFIQVRCQPALDITTE